MTNDRYIAAIEISSSKIIGAVGRTHQSGRVDVLAVESERTEECVALGMIQNLEEAAMRIRRVIDKLEKKPEIAPRKIAGMYIGLSGRSLRSITADAKIHLPEDTEITDEILDRLRDKALGSLTDNSLDVIDAVPRTFKVGNIETLSPKGTIGQDISATYDLIVCRPEMRRNINRTLPEKLGIRNEGFIVTAMSTGHLLLTPEEKRLGCMLVDLGAETTTVSIYKFGHLQFFATIPLGGRNITRDLTSLNMLEERAEDIKRTSGNAIPSESAASINLNGLKLSDVSNIIVARAEEIVTNVFETINHAGLSQNDLPGGLVCIGGASKLNGILELLSNKSRLPVRRGTLPAFIRLEDPKASSTDCIEVATILYDGASLNDAECLEAPQREGIPPTGTPNQEETPGDTGETPRTDAGAKPSQSKFWNKIKKGIAGYFSAEEYETDLL